MANIKSAKKRVKVTTRRHAENRGKKSELQSALKKFRALVNAGEVKQAGEFYKEVAKLLDSAVSHGRLQKITQAAKKLD